MPGMGMWSLTNTSRLGERLEPPAWARSGRCAPPELGGFTKPTRFQPPSAQLSAGTLPTCEEPAGGWAGSGQGPVPAGDAGTARSPARRGDSCTAPRARAGLFLSLVALTLTFLAVPLAPALLANPFYRRLNLAQASKQNLLGTATRGSAAPPRPRRPGGAAGTGGTRPAPCRWHLSPAVSPLLPRRAPAASPRPQRRFCSHPPAASRGGSDPRAWKKAGGKARLAAVANKEQPWSPRGAGSEPKIHAGLICTPQRLCKAGTGWGVGSARLPPLLSN